MEKINPLLKKYQEMDQFESVILLHFDQQGIHEDTPLHVACYRGAEDDVREMLKTNIDINVKGDIGNTPLHDAVAGGHSNIVLILLEAGADPLIENDYGSLPINFSDEINKEEIQKIIALFNSNA